MRRGGRRRVGLRLATAPPSTAAPKLLPSFATVPGVAAFTTARLTVEELDGSRLASVLPVYLSNLAYLELTEGSGGEAATYDLARLERDLAVAQMAPGRRVAALLLEPDREVVGVLDWLDAHPEDGEAWIGLLMIHGDRQGDGLATEAFEGLAEHLRRDGRPAVRAAVIDRNEAGRGLVAKLGFVPVGEETLRLPGGPERLVVYELGLDQSGVASIKRSRP